MNLATHSTRGRSEDGLKSLVKVVKVLESFTTNDRTLSLADICKKTGFPRSTTHRLLVSLREVGFVEQDRERDRYRLGIRLFEFGNIFLANLELHREARPIVDSLQRLTGHAIHLAVFDGLRAIVVNRAEPSTESGFPITIIENAPVHCTSVGKAILAFQPDHVFARVVAAGLVRYTDTTITDPDALAAEMQATRARGYAIDNGEHQPGLRCVGAPIYNQNGIVFAAISVSGPSVQLPLANVDEISRIAIYHANLVSRRLGYSS